VGINMIEKRNFWKFVVLSFITLGIYTLYTIEVVSRDTNTICESDGKHTQGLLGLIVFGIITIGIYPIVCVYQLGNRLRNNAQKYNITIKDGGGTLLLWFVLYPLFFNVITYIFTISEAEIFWIIITYIFIIISPFIGWHVIIKNINALADEYNKKQPSDLVKNKQEVALVDNYDREPLPARPIRSEPTTSLRKGTDEKYCVNCGAPIKITNTFCSHCGARQN